MSRGFFERDFGEQSQYSAIGSPAKAFGGWAEDDGVLFFGPRIDAVRGMLVAKREAAEIGEAVGPAADGKRGRL